MFEKKQELEVATIDGAVNALRGMEKQSRAIQHLGAVLRYAQKNKKYLEELDKQAKALEARKVAMEQEKAKTEAGHTQTMEALRGKQQEEYVRLQDRIKVAKEEAQTTIEAAAQASRRAQEQLAAAQERADNAVKNATRMENDNVARQQKLEKDHETQKQVHARELMDYTTKINALKEELETIKKRFG